MLVFKDITIFNRCGKTDWKEKEFTDSGEFNGCRIKIWGMRVLIYTKWNE